MNIYINYRIKYINENKDKYITWIDKYKNE